MRGWTCSIPTSAKSDHKVRIDVSGLTKRYGSTLSIDDVSFEVPEGSIAGLLGPNGAGKSTTIRILTGLSRASGGRAAIGGFDVQRQHDSIRPRLGFLPEMAPSYPEMTVEGFLGFMAGTKGLRGRDADAEVARVLALLDLRAWGPRLIRNLSKGTRQRVGIAQALVGRPSLVILDEPTAGLDPAQIQEVRQFLATLRGQCTIFLSTHILPEVELSCDRVVVLNRGRLVLSGTLEELRRSPGGDAAGHVEIHCTGPRQAIEEALGAACPGIAFSVRTGSAGLLVVTARADGGDSWRPAAVRAIVTAGGDVSLLEVRRPSLEEIYLRAVSAATRATGGEDAALPA